MNLLRLELRKLIPYRTVWLVLGFFTVLFLLFFNAGRNLSFNNSKLGSQLYGFPAVWQNGTWLASYFNLLLAILIIVVVTDEFVFRTFRQQVIDGLSRLQLVLGKVWVILTVAVACTAVVFCACLVLGLAHSTGDAGVLRDAWHTGGYALHAVAYMSLALLVAVLVRRSGLAIMAFLIYAYVLEALVRSQLPDNIDRFLPMKVFDALTPNESTAMLAEVAGIQNTTLALPAAAAMAALYCVLFWALAYVVLRERDL